jgi:hypothetical protein
VSGQPSGSSSAQPARQGTAGEPQIAASPEKVTRREVWKKLGAPTDQVGSVNDPRSHDEHGVRWNEKWIYRDGGEVVRVVLWNRYDFLGAFRVRPDGTAEPEALPG